MRESMIALIQEAVGGCSRHWAELIADKLIENGFNKRDCEIGDLVFVFRCRRKRPRGGYWDSICSTPYQIRYAKEHNEIYISAKKATKTDIVRLGYTVFKSRTEAENALKKYKVKDDDCCSAVEICPHCGEQNVYPNRNVQMDGYVAKCNSCGKEIMLCDECFHADDNTAQNCDWCATVNGGKCFRGVTHNCN